MAKSPFFIKQDFLSQHECAKIRTQLELPVPNRDAYGKPIGTEFSPADLSNFVFYKLSRMFHELESYYEYMHVGCEPLIFQQFPEGIEGPIKQPGCETHHFSRRKWIRHANRSLSAYLWLVDFADNTPFNPKTNVMGCKLEFPQYNFGFKPKAGTLVVYPASPHFVSAISPINAGILHQVKINLTGNSAKTPSHPWTYDAANFPRDEKLPIEAWFAGV